MIKSHTAVQGTNRVQIQCNETINKFWMFQRHLHHTHCTPLVQRCAVSVVKVRQQHTTSSENRYWCNGHHHETLEWGGAATYIQLPAGNQVARFLQSWSLHTSVDDRSCRSWSGPAAACLIVHRASQNHPATIYTFNHHLSSLSYHGWLLIHRTYRD